MISRAGFIGTDVKSAFTSYDTIASSGSNLICNICNRQKHQPWWLITSTTKNTSHPILE